MTAANGASDEDKNPQHWDEYTNLQRTKHDLIQRYLGGWFSILGHTNGRIVYFDTHAGRGRYNDGKHGSPIVALQTLLKHSLREKILSSCEVVFYFVELDPENFESLLREVAALGALPKNIVVTPVRKNCYDVLANILQDLRRRRATLAPAFVFVDPYNFAIPGSMLKELMSYPKVELFINLMWRELDMRMHIQDQPHVEKEIDELMLGPGWKSILELGSFDERAHTTINLLRERIGALWATYIFMLKDHSAIRYILLHLTNHELGRDLIKECLWKICPQACSENTFFARKSEDYKQLQLIVDEPDLRPLEDWLTAQLRKAPCRWQSLYSELRKELWTRTHLHRVVSEMKKQGKIVATGFEGRFSEKANRILALSPQA